MWKVVKMCRQWRKLLWKLGDYSFSIVNNRVSFKRRELIRTRNIWSNSSGRSSLNWPDSGCVVCSQLIALSCGLHWSFLRRSIDVDERWLHWFYYSHTDHPNGRLSLNWPDSGCVACSQLIVLSCGFLLKFSSTWYRSRWTMIRLLLLLSYWPRFDVVLGHMLRTRTVQPTNLYNWWSCSEGSSGARTRWWYADILILLSHTDAIANYLSAHI